MRIIMEWFRALLSHWDYRVASFSTSLHTFLFLLSFSSPIRVLCGIWPRNWLLYFFRAHDEAQILCPHGKGFILSRNAGIQEYQSAVGPSPGEGKGHL